MASLSNETMQTIPFDPRWPKTGFNFPVSFSITLATKHFLFGLRFPNQNQTRNCWQNYVDFHRCQKLKVCRLMKRFTASWFLKMKGEDYEPCNFFAKNFQTVCPNAWIEKWNEQREKVLLTFWYSAKLDVLFWSNFIQSNIIPSTTRKMNNLCFHYIYHCILNSPCISSLSISIGLAHS